MNEEGDEDDGSDEYFFLKAITLPEMDETSSGSECDDPQVQTLQKCGRGRPLKAQVPDSAQGNVILEEFLFLPDSLYTYTICFLGPFQPFYWCWEDHDANECLV